MSRLVAWGRAHLLLLVVCAVCISPLWVVRYPPMDDLPVHVATIRILHDFANPAFDFHDDYQLTLGRTQYIGFYAAGYLLAALFGAFAAGRLLVSFYVAGVILGTRSLLGALGRDRDLAYVVVPTLYGTLFGIGLLPFLVSLPLLLWGLAALARRATAPSVRGHVAVAAFGVLLFYVHVISLGIFLVGGLVLFPFRSTKRAFALAAASFVPPVAALAWWILMTNVGRRVLEITSHWGTSNRAPFLTAVGDIHTWLTDAYPDASDEVTAAALVGAILFTSWLAFRDPDTTPIRLRRYGLVPLLCLLAYLTGERQRGAIWPLAQRYILPAALAAVPLLAMPAKQKWKTWATAAILASGLLSIANTTWHFVSFQREVGDLQEAFAQMGPNKHVASLIYNPYAKSSRFRPFLHIGSYYQAEKAGVVAFTFAGYDQWPLDFQPGRYPIYDGPATPRWEFLPAEVVATQPLGYFDYLLARDRDRAPVPRGYRKRWSDRRWEVFEREEPAAPRIGQ